MKKTITIILTVMLLSLVSDCSAKTNNTVGLSEPESIPTSEAIETGVLTSADKGRTTENLSSDELIKDESFADSLIAIQDLFEPRYVTIYMEGMAELVRYYPYGKIADAGTKGMASYVIFIEDSYQVKQQDNLLRAVPFWDMPTDLPEVFMEIKQIANTSVEEMERTIKDAFDLSHYYFFREQYDDHFPFVGLVFYDGFERDSTVVSIYIKDNAQGGVFVITINYFLEAAGGHGIRFRNSLKTMVILETSHSTSQSDVLTLRFTIGNPNFSHNGTTQQAEAAPFLSNGRTMVPIRIIAEALGAEAGWDDVTRTVTITGHDGETLSLVVDIPLPDNMGTPTIVNGLTFVPARYVSEALGAFVRWDETNSAIYVSA